MGSAIGQLIVGRTSEVYGWQYGYLLVIAIIISATMIPVTVIMILDYREMARER